MSGFDWSPLQKALACLRAERVDLHVWWRDDDAITHTDALEQLSELSERVGIPVHLAVIPGNAQPDLARFIAKRAHLIPVVHGWRHLNHAPTGAKKAEFGHPRPTGHNDIADAVNAMNQLFHTHYLPLFVPPWNRFDPSFLDPLKTNGFKGVSTFGTRRSPRAARDLLQINTHIDPIDWRGSRDLVHPDTLIREAADLVLSRLDREQAADEPLGYLTHHLVHSPRIWTFSECLLKTLLDGGATAQPIAPLLETST